MSLGSPQRAEAAPHPRIVEDPPSSGYKRRTLQTRPRQARPSSVRQKTWRIASLCHRRAFDQSAVRPEHPASLTLWISSGTNFCRKSRACKLANFFQKGVGTWIGSPFGAGLHARWSSAQKGRHSGRPGARCPAESPAFALNYRIAHAAWRKLLCEATRSQ